MKISSWYKSKQIGRRNIECISRVSMSDCFVSDAFFSVVVFPPAFEWKAIVFD